MVANSIKIKILVQRTLNLLILPALYCFYWGSLYIIKRYSIPEIKKLRQQFKDLRKNSDHPLLICPNHLTYVDSIILIIAFGSFVDYLFNFYSFAWNFPKTTHIKKNWFYKIICYLGKCIFIKLDAPSEQLNQPMNIAKYLLSKGEYIMLFPEGHRSNNGIVDTNNFTYGAGKLITEIPNIRVLCVYLRGSSQKYSSNFPNKYDHFYCKLKPIDVPKAAPDSSTLRNIRDTSHHIIQQLSYMEQEYLQTISTEANN